MDGAGGNHLKRAKKNRWCLVAVSQTKVAKKAPASQVRPIVRMPPPLPPNSTHDLRVQKEYTSSADH